MKFSFKNKAVLVGLGASLLAATLSISPATASPAVVPAPAPVSGPVKVVTLDPLIPAPKAPTMEEKTRKLPAAQRKLALSGVPAVLTVDVKSGEVTSVTPTSDFAGVSTLGISTNNTCQTGEEGCYYSGQTPWADFGFKGTGTATGNWPYRSAYGSKTRYNQACSTFGCYVKARPGQFVQLTGTATGTSYTLF
ncbi:hypothetical protein [Arthrobacter sp. RAF14]|uniref:hypothetical protein n=1 Tax=Arthrobacter sp. RAF14 TaxID=3233051 RepID=UPI003F92CE98